MDEPKEAERMSLPDDFTKLREKVDKADQSIRAAAAKDDAELKAMVDDARKKADERAAVSRAKSDEVAESAEGQWHEVQGDWDGHIKRMRERMDAKKDALDAKVAEQDAEWAEADALDAVGAREERLVADQRVVEEALVGRQELVAVGADRCHAAPPSARRR